jgi:hypothetical protein
MPSTVDRTPSGADGSIAQDLVRDDPVMARAAKEAAKVLLRNAGIDLGEAG